MDLPHFQTSGSTWADMIPDYLGIHEWLKLIQNGDGFGIRPVEYDESATGWDQTVSRYFQHFWFEGSDEFETMISPARMM